MGLTVGRPLTARHQALIGLASIAYERDQLQAATDLLDRAAEAAKSVVDTVVEKVEEIVTPEPEPKLAPEPEPEPTAAETVAEPEPVAAEPPAPAPEEKKPKLRLGRKKKDS